MGFGDPRRHAMETSPLARLTAAFGPRGTPIPDIRERQLTMLLAGSATSRESHGAAAIAELVAACDEDALIALLRRLRLTALLGGRLLAISPPEALPRLAVAVGDAIRHARGWGRVQAIIQWSLLGRLSEAGIPAAPLKGPDLAQRIYGDLGLRSSADVDLLVAASRLDDAVRVVQALGYGPGPPQDAPWLTELHRELLHPADAMPVVEVHWRTEWYSASAGTGGFAQVALERSRPDSQGHGRQLQPADELAVLLLVYARDCLVGLRLAADIAAWWDRYGSAVPDGALQEIVDADRPLATPLAVAASVCARLVDLPAVKLIDLSPAARPRGRLASRLADPFLDLPTVGSASSLVDGLFSSRATLQPFLRRRVLPPIGHIERTYGAREGPLRSVRLRLLQAQHPVRRAAHYAGLLWSPPPAPETSTARGARSSPGSSGQ